MKRVIAIVFAALALAGLAVADEEVLINFSELSADFTVTDETVGDHQENQRTLVDFGTVAGSTYTDVEKATMKTSLAIKNWEVVLSASSRTVLNQKDSMVKEAKVKDDAPEGHFAGEPVLGVRVHFPTEMYNAWALIKPPFEIPAYQDKTTAGDDGTLTVADEDRGRGDMFTNIGVVKNVGVLKSLSMNVYGLDFPHKISVILKNANNEEQEILLGNLLFPGWASPALKWENPNYITEVRNRTLRQYPLYPKMSPMVKLVGIRIYRDGLHEGDDFIGYVKDIKIVFDKAVLTDQRDIDDEAVWEILQTREAARRTAELRRLGNIQVLRYLETQKMDNEERRQQEQQDQGGQQQQQQGGQQQPQ